ncbi:DUF3667 domain-containing protein [Catalinimonas niigatensis]|uniref:DUF3667 domain-containing protein n=1 Tax=Catalinimonas niigatensis TaxID=1397264 RepID=UPI002666F9C0|nr:DUF3667 domain-containing protein [Catalinimonas niigatensis]WPP49556.1 DUF3667 domain-containing protein [Catalinimonas niigatensis]
MRIRRKTKSCLNCGLTLNELYHYCPRCGQENNDHNVSFGMLVKEFFLNYFSLDTKFIRSIVPFLIKPGYLTLRFSEGKRASYVNPLRLYLIISVIFFFLSTLWVTDSLSVLNETDDTPEVDIEVQVDSVQQPVDSIIGSGWELIPQILEDETLSDQQALDSIQTITEIKFDAEAYLNQLAFKQLRKVAQKDLDVFAGYVMQNMPVMMFLLLPVFALILKLLYIRHKTLYVNHLIHGIHLHAFAFFLTILILLINIAVNLNDSLSGGWMFLMLQIFILLYALFSFKKVYQQGWFKTLIKLFLLSSVYFLVLLMFGLSETIISFLIF